MRIVYMGTPASSAVVLRTLSDSPKHEVAAVYTRPDAVRGRGKRLEPSPVKAAALERGIPVHEPKTLRDPEAQEGVAALEPDAICVAAFGAILPPEVLSIPRYGCLNVHSSLLPRWRGAAPVQRAILAGDEKTGVSVMRMEAGLDTGDYCLERSVDVADKTAEELTMELAGLGAQALLEALDRVEDGTVEWIRQDESQATYASKIAKGELDLSPDDAAALLERKVRASGGSHPARALVAGRTSTLLRLAALDDEACALTKGMEAGEVRFASKRLFLGCSDGAVELLSIKPDGKKPMGAQAFAAGVQGIKQIGSTWEGLS